MKTWATYECKACGAKSQYLAEQGEHKQIVHTLCECQTDEDGNKFCTDHVLLHDAE